MRVLGVMKECSRVDRFRHFEIREEIHLRI